MALLENVEIYFVKLEQDRPSARFDKLNPTWEVQMRTNDPVQMQEWKQLNLAPKLVVHPDDHENAGEAILTPEGNKQWRCNLRKRSVDSKGRPADAPTLVDGNLQPVDPRTVGNGSVANIQIYQYEYPDPYGKGTKIGTQMQAVQLLKHMVYLQQNDSGFTKTQTEVITPAATSNNGNADNDDDNGDDEDNFSATPALKPKAKSVF